MDITHLHLNTRDRARSEAFYRDWFGLAVKKKGETITFMKGERDFLLVLMDDAEPAEPPPWFHFGMCMDSPDAVRAKHDALAAGGVAITRPMKNEPAITSFRCADPNGYSIEIYWLPD